MLCGGRWTRRALDGMHSAWIRLVEEGDIHVEGSTQWQLILGGEPCTEDCVFAGCVVEVVAA